MEAIRYTAEQIGSLGTTYRDSARQLVPSYAGGVLIEHLSREPLGLIATVPHHTDVPLPFDRMDDRLHPTGPVIQYTCDPKDAYGWQKRILEHHGIDTDQALYVRTHIDPETLPLVKALVRENPYIVAACGTTYHFNSEGQLVKVLYLPRAINTTKTAISRDAIRTAVLDDLSEDDFNIAGDTLTFLLNALPDPQ